MSKNNEKLQKLIRNLKTGLKIVIPTIIVVVVMFLVSDTLSSANDESKAKEQEEVKVVEENAIAVASANILEADKFPEINSFISSYLQALADGNVEVISNMSNNISDTEKIRIVELGKHIDAFPEYNVFTKNGPELDSYVVYVVARAKMVGLEPLIPGVYSFYVCRKEDGSFYLNEGVLTDEEATYIVALESDEAILSLLDKIDVEYEVLLNTNEEVKTYMELLLGEIRDAVGTALVELEEETKPVEVVEEVTVDETVIATTVTAILKDTLNVRSSDSTSSDILGKIQRGTTVDVIEMRVNGWSKIMFEDKEAFIKTDFLEVVEEEKTE